MRGKLRAIFKHAPALVLASALASSINAQTSRRQTRARPAATPSSTSTQTRGARAGEANARETPPRAEESGAEPDLSITAHVTAKSLRFEKVPNPKVEFTGEPRRETVWESERQNLPQQVQPGVTYRDIGITLRITSVFADIDRIVAEALGEVPVTDDTPQENAAPPTTPPPAQASPATTPERKP